MADRSNAVPDPRRHLAVDAPPPPILKEMQGSENPIPLSPQWLLPKPVDSKLGILSGDPHSSPYHGSSPDALRESGFGEDSHNVGKRKDVFRPSSYDLDSGRHDRWRDEERETHSVNRRDRWRETEKEVGDTRRTERWSDNFGKYSGEARRAPVERWSDSANRDNNYDQRRESKWNTRWGPDDKESENQRDKRMDPCKSYEGSLEQQVNHSKDITTQGKDSDKEGDHTRSWRSNSFLARGRGESNFPQALSPNKKAPPFGYGRGKGENGASVFSSGRGRVDPSMSTVNSVTPRSYPLGFNPERSDSSHGDPLRYGRMKLLEIYRMTDLKTHRLSLEEFMDVPSLTISEPVEPVALSAPTSEELVTLKGIDKGEIVNSGLPQVSKEGSTGKNFADSVMSRQSRSGSKEDAAFPLGDFKDETSDSIKGDYSSYLEGPQAKNSHQHGNQESKLSEDELERSASYHNMPWRSQAVGDHSHKSSVDWHDSSAGSRSRASDMDRLHLQKNMETEQKNTSYFRDKSQWQNTDFHSEDRTDFKVKGQSEDALFHNQEDPFFSREKSVGKFTQSAAPEDLTLYYKDPQGQIQGPFTGGDLIGWFEAGYFGIDLLVRVANAPADAPFSLLGDVMPHLRAKASPPPGFGVAKQNDVSEVSSRGKLGSLGKVNSVASDYEAIKNTQTNRYGVATEAENRFIESLMSGNTSSSASEHHSISEGIKGYIGPSTRTESMNDMNYMLVQKMSLDRQRSMSTVPYWSGREASSIGIKPDMVSESPSPQPKFLPHVGEASHQIPQAPQQVDFLSMLQAAAEKSSLPAVNPAPIWPNLNEVSSTNNLVHGGIDIVKDKIDVHHNQHITSQTGYGAQNQRLHPQTQPSLSHLMGQPMDLSSGVAPPEKLLASEISQDPQLLALLQQQYLMSHLQLHSQSPLPSQLSLVDKYILLKQQQQKHEQQQQQLLLQQQQQRLLSQVLTVSAPQPHQHFGELSLGHLRASVPAGNASLDYLGIRPVHETPLNNQPTPVLNSVDGCSSTFSNPIVQGAKNVSDPLSTELCRPHLPHEMFGHLSQTEGWDTNLPKDKNIIESYPEITHEAVDSFHTAEPIGKNTTDALAKQTNELHIDNKSVQNMPLTANHTKEKENMTITSAGGINDIVSGEARISVDATSFPETFSDADICPQSIPQKSHDPGLPVKEVKAVEVKETKKASDKKSRKQKNKTQLVLEHGKGSSKHINGQQIKLDSENEANIGAKKDEFQMETEESLHMSSTLEAGLPDNGAYAAESLILQHGGAAEHSLFTNNEVGSEGKAELGNVVPSINSQAPSGNRAWKPAPGLKPKSLLEIQQEEQRRLQTVATAVEVSAVAVPVHSSRTPWVGVVANVEQKSGVDIVQNLNSAEAALGYSANSDMMSRSKKSQLHDLLAEEVLAKSNEADNHILDEKDSLFPPFAQVAPTDIQSVDDDFVEAKDTKKSRKKAAKAAKAAGLKASPPASAYLSAPLVSVDKSKSARQTHQEKDLLPAPVGPSLGDFVLWKGDQANSPAPAWSTDSAKLQKPTSLREILMEQGKKNSAAQQQIPIQIHPKVQSNRGNHGSGSWPIPASSPTKVASPSQTKPASPGRTTAITSNQAKPRADDDLFWGPLDQTKQEAKLTDFPSLANPNSFGGKGSSSKGAPGGSLTRQKPTRVGLSSPAASQSSSKGKRDAVSKSSEAMDFRNWCESELVKLTGTNDTSFLEYCLKQSTAEAEMMLRENLGSMDQNHQFIDKFLNYKDFLSPDVIEMAFGAQNNNKLGEDTLSGRNTRISKDIDAEAGGKKKGKKGKKVSPAVLGFNVVSNRIMMGEIQTVED